MYMNNSDVSASDYRTGFLGVENALNFIYAMGMGDMTVGGGLYYAKSAKNPDAAAISAANPKASQDAMGLYFSAESKAGWDAQFALGLANNAKMATSGAGDTKLTGKTTYKLSGGYHMDTMYFFGTFGAAGAKAENAAGTSIMDRSDASMSLGVINSHKKDGSDFFYGISYESMTLKDEKGSLVAVSGVAGAEKIESTVLPIIVGMEVEANSWLTVRGSIKQNFFLLTSEKVSTAAVAAVKNENKANTTVAAGLGMKFGKLMFDGTHAASDATGASDGMFGTDGANFLGNVALTYLF